MTSTDNAENKNAAAAVDTALDAAKALSPEERQKQFQAFMAKVLSDVSRTRLQIDFTHRHYHGEVVAIHERLDHLEAVLGMICESLHIEMPKMAPKLIDAKVELVQTLDEGEVCEMRAAHTAHKHPIFGHLQVLLGPADDAQIADAKQLHPILLQRLDEAFDALRGTAEFVDGQFYYVRLGLIHAQPINDTSVPYNVVKGATEPAANDDGEPTQESGDAEHE